MKILIFLAALPLLEADPKPLTAEQQKAYLKAQAAAYAAELDYHRIKEQADAVVAQKREAAAKEAQAFATFVERLRKDAGAEAACQIDREAAWTCPKKEPEKK